MITMYNNMQEEQATDGFINIWQNLNWMSIVDLLLPIIPAVICLTVHELSHGLAAYWLGDSTAKLDGRISLNPLRHIDPLGFLMLVFVGFGWAKPVMVDMRRFKNPKVGMAITAFAGPLSNILLAIAIMPLYGAFVFYANEMPATVADYGIQIITSTIYLNIGLAVFNMFPIPPLDGSKIFEAVLPESLYFKIMRYERYGMIILLALVVTGTISPAISFITSAVANSITPIAVAVFNMLQNTM